MKKNTLNKLKSDYEELKVNPSLDLWDRLDKKLNESHELPLKSSFQWWKYAAVVLLMISVGTIIYFNTDKNNFGKGKSFSVKKVPANKIQSTYPEFKDLSVDLVQESVKNEKTIVANRRIDNSKAVKEKKNIQAEISKFKTQQIAFKQENIDIKPIEIKNTIPNSPIIAETKKTKTSYINSNELLLGHEFDKTKENPYKNDIKFGVFNFDKPKVENVTVLGVSVYIDSK